MARDEEAHAKLDEILRLLKTRPASTGGATVGSFPNYGKCKNGAIAGAREGDLRFYRRGCLRSLGDASKAKFHDKERSLLAAIDEELRKQGLDPEDDKPSQPARASDRFQATEFGDGSDDGGIPF